MATSLLFPSTKRERGALDHAKVTKIIGKSAKFVCSIYINIFWFSDLINKRYSTYEWDMKTFVSKANQKCRDCNL